MAKILKVFNKINTLRERYYKVSIGKEALLKIILETEVAEQVYNSNAIENSTLTLEETEKILLQIDLDRYITEREMFEAKNLARVVSYIDQRAKEQELTPEVILSADLEKTMNSCVLAAILLPTPTKWLAAWKKCYPNIMPRVMRI